MPPVSLLPAGRGKKVERRHLYIIINQKFPGEKKDGRFHEIGDFPIEQIQV